MDNDIDSIAKSSIFNQFKKEQLDSSKVMMRRWVSSNLRDLGEFEFDGLKMKKDNC